MPADTSKQSLAFIAESAWGTTPATPELTPLRYTSEGLKAATKTVTSQEIRGDRQSAGPVRVGVNVEGPIAFEMTYGTWDAWFEALLQSTFSTNVLINGTTPTSFSLQKKWDEGTDIYQTYTGVMVDQAELSFRPQEIANGSFTVRGKAEDASTSAITGATFAAATTGPPMNTVDGISAITEGGGALGDVREITLRYTNNLRERPKLGDLYGLQPGSGTIGLTGTLVVYCPSTVALLSKYHDWTASSLAWTISDGSSDYQYSVPALKYTDGKLVAGSINGDGLVELAWEAYEGAGGHTLQITRAP